MNKYGKYFFFIFKKRLLRFLVRDFKADSICYIICKFLCKTKLAKRDIATFPPPTLFYRQLSLLWQKTVGKISVVSMRKKYAFLWQLFSQIFSCIKFECVSIWNSFAISFCFFSVQFHQHFMSAFGPILLCQKMFKPVKYVRQSFARNFCIKNVGEIDTSSPFFTSFDTTTITMFNFALNRNELFYFLTSLFFYPFKHTFQINCMSKLFEIFFRFVSLETQKSRQWNLR